MRVSYKLIKISRLIQLTLSGPVYTFNSRLFFNKSLPVVVWRGFLKEIELRIKNVSLWSTNANGKTIVLRQA